jgi:hypothetical protein
MKRKLLWLLLLPLALLATVALAFFLFNRTTREAVELALQGGEVQLREPMRPIRGTTRLLLVALDGVGDGMLRETIRMGRMPEVAAILGPELGDGLYAQAYAAPDAMAIIPSTTMAA